MNPAKRPTSVSVIAWVLIVIGVLKLGLAPLGFAVSKIQQALVDCGMTLTTAVLWQAILGGILVVSGVAILKGLGWGRVLYLLCAAVSNVSVWLLYGFYGRSLLSAAVYIVSLIVLTRPGASDFFASGNSK